MPTEPSTQQVPMFCKCGHEWPQTIIVGIEINLFNKFMKSLSCPECGSRDIFMGRKNKKKEGE